MLYGFLRRWTTFIGDTAFFGRPCLTFEFNSSAKLSAERYHYSGRAEEIGRRFFLHPEEGGEE
jgi:hypothetical protein